MMEWCSDCGNPHPTCNCEIEPVSESSKHKGRATDDFATISKELRRIQLEEDRTCTTTPTVARRDRTSIGWLHFIGCLGEPCICDLPYEDWPKIAKEMNWAANEISQKHVIRKNDAPV